MGTVNNMQIQDDEGNIYHPETTIKQIIDESGNQMFPGGKPGNMDSREMAATFEEAKTRENIKSGEKHGVIFGKIQKFLTDLKAVAFSGKYGDLSERPSLGGASVLGVANNCTTTEAGFALDARQGKTLMDKSNELSRDFETQLPDDVRIIHEGSGEDVKYYAQLGADTTSKKLLGRQPIDFITIVHGDSSWALTRLYIPDGYSKLDVYLERGAGSIYGYIGNEEEDPYGAKLGAISMTSQTFDLSEYVIVGIRADGNNARAHGHFY